MSKKVFEDKKVCSSKTLNLKKMVKHFQSSQTTSKTTIKNSIKIVFLQTTFQIHIPSKSNSFKNINRAA